MTTKRGNRGAPTGVRIIAGSWRGTKLALPAGTRARPTPDRVRETLFNWVGPRIEGAHCLDLFAGSGILGLEALSRGAASVDFVERDGKLTKAIAAQLERLDTDPGGRGRVHCIDAARYLEACPDGIFDVAFVDPPYETSLEPSLSKLWHALRAGALVYAERPVDAGLPILTSGRWIRQSRAGNVAFAVAIV